MDDGKINNQAVAGAKDTLQTTGEFKDEFAEQRSRIEAMVADPSRTAMKSAELRRLVEDLRQRVPAGRDAEFGRFFKGVEAQLAEFTPLGEDAGTPSALDVADSGGSNAPVLGARQP